MRAACGNLRARAHTRNLRHSPAPSCPAAGVRYRARITQQGGRRGLLQAPLVLTAESGTPTIEFIAGQGSPRLPQLCGLAFTVEAQWQNAAGASPWVAAPGTVTTGACPS